MMSHSKFLSSGFLFNRQHRTALLLFLLVMVIMAAYFWKSLWPIIAAMDLEIKIPILGHWLHIDPHTHITVGELCKRIIELTTYGKELSIGLLILFAGIIIGWLAGLRWISFIDPPWNMTRAVLSTSAVITYMEQLAKTFEKKRMYDAALWTLKELLALRKRLYGRDAVELCDSLESLAAAEQQSKNHARRRACHSY